MKRVLKFAVIVVCALTLVSVVVVPQTSDANLIDAKKAYEITISIVEEVRSELVMESLSKSFAGMVQELYQEYLDLIAEMGELQEALPYAERARSRSLLDILVSDASAKETVAEVEGMTAQGTVDAEEISRLIHGGTRVA